MIVTVYRMWRNAVELAFYYISSACIRCIKRCKLLKMDRTECSDKCLLREGNSQAKANTSIKHDGIPGCTWYTSHGFSWDVTHATAAVAARAQQYNAHGWHEELGDLEIPTLTLHN